MFPSTEGGRAMHGKHTSKGGIGQGVGGVLINHARVLADVGHVTCCIVVGQEFESASTEYNCILCLLG